MKAKNKRSIFSLLRVLSLIVLILIAAVYFLVTPDVSIQKLLNHTPSNPAAAAAGLLALYLIKSATVFFPLVILEIAAGHLFSPWAALLVNLLGILITLTVPYWIGRMAGMGTIQKLINKYPKFGEILEKQQDSTFFLCFILRIINCLPGDIVTMYFGAVRVPFWQNLAAGTLGILPGMILATFMGGNIQDPRSPCSGFLPDLPYSLPGFRRCFTTCTAAECGKEINREIRKFCKWMP